MQRDTANNQCQQAIGHSAWRTQVTRCADAGPKHNTYWRFHRASLAINPVTAAFPRGESGCIDAPSANATTAATSSPWSMRSATPLITVGTQWRGFKIKLARRGRRAGRRYPALRRAFSRGVRTSAVQRTPSRGTTGVDYSTNRRHVTSATRVLSHRPIEAQAPGAWSAVLRPGRWQHRISATLAREAPPSKSLPSRWSPGV